VAIFYINKNFSKMKNRMRAQMPRIFADYNHEPAMNAISNLKISARAFVRLIGEHG